MSEYFTRKGLEGIFKKTFLRKRLLKGINNLDILIFILFIFGMALLVWEISIYRRTIIELKIPLLIWLTPGFFMTPLLYNRFKRIEAIKKNRIFHYLVHTCITGASLLFGFMALNYYFADNQTEDKRFEIIKKGSLSGRNRNEDIPYVEINYNGFEKEIIFKYPDKDKIDSAKYVNLTVKKGLFGFDILERYEAE